LRSHVFTDAALKKQAGRFVWLSIDTEKEQNRAFIDAHPIEVWPTLLVLDPSGHAALRWAGALDATQLVKLLDDGERAIAGQDALGRADKLAADGKPADAVKAYQEALGQIAEDKKPRVVEELVLALSREGDPQKCADTARAWEKKLPRGSSYANVASMGLSCALDAPKEASWRAAAISELATAAGQAVELPGLLADDRSGVYETIVAAKIDAGDVPGAKAAAGKWLGFLEKEAAAAKTPEARAAFDPHRLNAAMALGEPARVVPALQQSEKDLPKDYNPPARLVTAYKAMGKLDDALAASDRALSKAYGPRRLRILDMKAKVQLEKGDRAGAKATIAEGVKIASELPASQHGPQLLARWQKKLAEMK
jgi:tetratricopeptide (TPR) repeat protein